MEYVFPTQSQYRIAQITDCHLMPTADEYYQQIQPAKYLQAVVAQLCQEQPDALILSGDLVQNASVASYQLLADICAPLTCPVFCLPGNHDDLQQLALLSQQAPFQAATSLRLACWQLLLLNTKGPTPSGVFGFAQQQWLQQQLQQSRAQAVWLFCHHHPRPLGGSIDNHGQLDAEILWQQIFAEPRIQGIAHGHSHYAYSARFGKVSIVGCPASSVQFLMTPEWQTVDQGPQWCDWLFNADETVQWQFRSIDRNKNK
jgi:3',5'-cyclic-AMP phosphodiesterase